MDETLTVHRLRAPAQLRRTLASTNVIESASSLIRRGALSNDAEWACASPERRTDRPELATVRINGELRY